MSGAMSTFGVRLGIGAYLWNVQCVDLAGNGAFNGTNHTAFVMGDVAATNLTFSTAFPTDGQNITLIANVTNNVNTTETILVQFWNGAPGIGVELGNASVTIGPYGSNVTIITWIATLGLHNFFIVVDPPNGTGQINESDEGNNLFNRSLLVPIWQGYYGNITGGVTLDTAMNFSFRSWGAISGNVYVSDSDTTGGISFASLRPVGRNATGGSNASTSDDFSEIDASLGTTSYADSVNRTFTTGGAPVAVQTFSVFGQPIANVSVVNSTSDGSFTVGPLWDASDGAPFYSNAEKQDLVFITRIQNGTSSVYGIVDYATRIPAQLVGYKPGASTVTFYYEVN
jgi:hypothetical protein